MTDVGGKPSRAGQVLLGRRRSIALLEPAVMGVLNVTPDSFSDGGSYLSVEAAVARALAMVEEGASIIDIGGESTRPGAAQVSVDEEQARVLPVIEALRGTSDVFISVDTSCAATIRAAGAADADMINDVRALTEPGSLAAAAEIGAAVCVMHMQGQPATMQARPQYADVVTEVRAFLAERVEACRQAGLHNTQIVVDPGFGFGKTLQHNLELLSAIGDLAVAGCPVLMGVSRKSMFAKLFATDAMADRINGSLGAAFWATLQGVGIIRAHDVRQTVQMVGLANALASR